MLLSVTQIIVSRILPCSYVSTSQLLSRMLPIQLLGLANTNHQLLDLTGEITAVKSTVTDPPQDKNRVMGTIEMDNGTSVTMSFFDTQAVGIHNQLEKMRVDPRVVVATSINQKMVGGRLF